MDFNFMTDEQLEQAIENQWAELDSIKEADGYLDADTVSQAWSFVRRCNAELDRRDAQRRAFFTAEQG